MEKGGGKTSAFSFSMNNELEYCERLNDRLSVIHRRDGVGTTTDALLLAALLPKKAGECCELGAGGGIVSLLAAARGRIGRGVLLEREPALCALAERNIQKNGLDATLTVLCADLREHLPSGHFTTVLANPPYRRAGEGLPARDRLADISRFERAGGIADFCRAAATLLAEDGRFYTVFPAARRSDLLTALEDAGLHAYRAVTVYPYPDGAPRLLLTVSGMGEGVLREATFTLCRAPGGAPTEAAERLYADGVLMTEGE